MKCRAGVAVALVAPLGTLGVAFVLSGCGANTMFGMAPPSNERYPWWYELKGNGPGAPGQWDAPTRPAIPSTDSLTRARLFQQPSSPDLFPPLASSRCAQLIRPLGYESLSEAQEWLAGAGTCSRRGRYWVRQWIGQVISDGVKWKLAVASESTLGRL
jgi:hypothetical protein